MLRTRIKICGITREQDGLQAALLGADAIGLVFHKPSPRHIEIEAAQLIIKSLPPFISKVALFLNASKDEVCEVLGNLNINLLQFHGTESSEFCEQFGMSYIKAIPMLEAVDFKSYREQYQGCSGFLLDAMKSGDQGGSGKTFAWEHVPRDLDKPIILAGGLNPLNVKQAIQSTACYGVDVSSGVEAAKGIKDTKKLKEFIEQVRMADYE